MTHPILGARWTAWLNKAAIFCLLVVWPALTFSSALMQISFWLAFAFCLLGLLSAREWPTLPDRISLIWLGLFFATVLISITVTDYPKQSFRGVIKVLGQLIVFLLSFHLFQTTASQSKLRVVILFSFCLLVADGFYQYFYGVDFLRGFAAQHATAGRRVSASFDQYGKLGAYLCTVLPVIIGWLLFTWKNAQFRRELGLWFALSVAGITLLVLTRSRGAFLALFIGFIGTLILRKSWKTFFALILIGVLFVAILPRSMIIHRDIHNKEQTLLERKELWYRAVQVIIARPLTGTGINTYAVAHQKYDRRKNWRVLNYYAHNGYLQMAAEIGLPGLFCFLIFLGRWVWVYRPRPLESSPEAEVRWGLFCGIIAFLVFCIVDTPMHSLQPIMNFWFVLGLLGALGSKLKERDEKGDQAKLPEDKNV